MVMDETNKNANSGQQLVTEEMNEFISSKPGRLLRYGNYILLLLLASMMIICWSIKTPDIVSVTGTVSSHAPVIPVRSLVAGYVTSFKFKQNELVPQNASLGFMKFSTEAETILGINKTLDSVEAMVVADERLVPGSRALPVSPGGELEQAYMHFVIDYKIYSLLQHASYAPGNRQWVIEKKTGLLESIGQLRIKIAHWRSKYELLAPAEGICVLSGDVRNNHFFNEGDTILFIYPRDPKYFVRIEIPQRIIQKVRIGQQVRLEFDAYPASTYGSLTGIIEFINPVATNNQFSAKIRLSDSLLTNQGEKLELKEGMSIRGIITIGNTSIINKINS